MDCKAGSHIKNKGQYLMKREAVPRMVNEPALVLTWPPELTLLKEQSELQGGADSATVVWRSLMPLLLTTQIKDKLHGEWTQPLKSTFFLSTHVHISQN
jgi:hypothetical protein